ncbi:class I SAM-dependent methyltransferase [Methanoregula sp.]|uniref:class I SAM-dependent methyltransferase n=1 Tax=Methanoregula sp. TaxID=2052170 RepID=UPI003568C3D7
MKKCNHEPCNLVNDSPIQNIDVDPDTYYGEIPKSDMETILKNSQKNGNIEREISRYCDRKKNEYFREYALDPRRALGLTLLGNISGLRILDYGCGIGSLGVVAARHGAHVTFIDNCQIRLEIARERILQSGLNGEFIACKDYDSLPPDLGSFDFILLNGVLEWIPVCRASFDNVLEIQLDFLDHMRQYLSPRGSIYLAIENRFALQYFMGYPEDHTDIPYLSLMDRIEANQCHQRLKGRDFLTWTWSLQEFKKLLPSVNLTLTEGYGIFPDYRFPRLITSLEDKDGLKKGMLMERYSAKNEFKNRFIDYVYNMDLIEHFIYSYCFLIGREQE